MTLGGPVGIDMKAVKARKDAVILASRNAIDSGKPAHDIVRDWEEPLRQFRARSQAILLYAE